MTYNRYEPEGGVNHAGLGAAIRRALTNEPKFIGPDTEGLSPGFHKQSDGKLMYVPDMPVLDKSPVYDEPEGDNPEDAGEPEKLDLRCDATRPSGFYDIENFNGEAFVRHWHSGLWFLTGEMTGKMLHPHKISYGVSGQEPEWSARGRKCRVLRARPDLDAMVQK